jgi:hypothetical protein
MITTRRTRDDAITAPVISSHREAQDMQISSTEFLRYLAQRNGYLVRRKGQGEITLKESDGRDMVIKDEHGRQVEPVLPTLIFDDFRDANLVRQDSSAPGEDVVYRLTVEGRERGVA